MKQTGSLYIVILSLKDDHIKRLIKKQILHYVAFNVTV
jgi:hypothetical protein